MAKISNIIWSFSTHLSVCTSCNAYVVVKTPYNIDGPIKAQTVCVTFILNNSTRSLLLYSFRKSKQCNYSRITCEFFTGCFVGRFLCVLKTRSNEQLWKSPSTEVFSLHFDHFQIPRYWAFPSTCSDFQSIPNFIISVAKILILQWTN